MRQNTLAAGTAPNFDVVRSALIFRNPYSTREEFGGADTTAALQALVPDTHIPRDVITKRAEPQDFTSGNGRKNLTIVHSGDGGVNGVLTAAYGIVKDDPEASSANYAAHKELLDPEAGNSFLILGGGNGNNVARSTLGKFALQPHFLAGADLLQVPDRSLVYHVKDVLGNTRHFGIATSTWGIGLETDAIELINEVKQAVKRGELPKRGARRYVREFISAYSGASRSKKLAGSLAIHEGATVSHIAIDGANGVSIAGSHILAKSGRMPRDVNIGTPFFQLLTPRISALPLANTFGTAALAMRLRTGIHKQKPLDFSSLDKITLHPYVTDPLLFQVDGEVSEAQMIYPGDRVSFHLTGLAAHILMNRSSIR